MNHVNNNQFRRLSLKSSISYRSSAPSTQEREGTAPLGISEYLVIFLRNDIILPANSDWENPSGIRNYLEVGGCQHGCHRVGEERAPQGVAQRLRPVVEGQQTRQCAGPHQTALGQRRRDLQVVLARFAEPGSVRIQWLPQERKCLTLGRCPGAKSRLAARTR